MGAVAAPAASFAVWGKIMECLNAWHSSG